MNYEKALHILELDMDTSSCDISVACIKKQYHKLALLNHPDKNDGTSESSDIFMEIKSAYEFLIKEVSNNTHKCDSLEQDDFMESNGGTSTMYITILKLFIKTVFNNPLKDNNSIYKIICLVVSNTKKISFNLFETFDKETLIDIYLFLTKYKSILHIEF
jgi:hypothetical protein